MSDRRRITPPQDTYFPQVRANRVSDIKERDPRTPASFYLTSSIVDNANGSAYIEVDNYIIQSQVFGPRPIKGSYVDRGAVSVECKFLTLIRQNTDTSNGMVSDSKSMSGFEHRMALFVETCLVSSVILERYPKSTIDVFVNILAADGKGVDASMVQRLTAWVVNCVSVAVVDAQIETKDIVTCGQAAETETPSTSVCVDTDTSAVQTVVAVMPMRNNEIVGLWIDGSSNGTLEFADTIDAAVEMARTVRSNINAYLLQQVE